MNYTLQLHGERVVYAVPPGLYELMSDVTREVLRDQPSMLYQYIARYLDTLVRVREYARTAGQLVDDTAQDNIHLLSYVDSLGLTFKQADQAARKIQRAFREHRAKHDVKGQVQRRLQEMAATESFRQFLETYDLDEDTASRASEVIQRAYREYSSKKQLDERRLSKDASTHTIETIAITPFDKEASVSLEKKPFKRDSKLLVYQQSPRESVVSSWSALGRDLAEKEQKLKSTQSISRPPELVYEQTDAMIYSYNKKPVSEYSITQREITPLPSYYDESQPKIPMISESGLLVKDDSVDVVTLFSTDSDDHTRFSEDNNIQLPTLSSLTISKPQDLAKELFGIIGNKNSSTSKSLLVKTSSKPGSQEVMKTTKEASVSRSVSKNVSIEKTLSKHISINEERSNSIRPLRKSSESAKPSLKTDDIQEETKK